MKKDIATKRASKSDSGVQESGVKKKRKIVPSTKKTKK